MNIEMRSLIKKLAKKYKINENETNIITKKIGIAIGNTKIAQRIKTIKRTNIVQ